MRCRSAAAGLHRSESRSFLAQAALALGALLACSGPAGAGAPAASAPPAAAVQAAVRPVAAEAARPAAERGAPKPIEREPAQPPAAQDPLDVLRDRLAQRLGASKAAAPSGQVVQVSNRAPGEFQVTAGSASRPSASARKPAHSEAATAHGAGAGHEPHWSYDGEGGPQRWGELKPEFIRCAIGKRQSPIDIRDGFSVDLEPVAFQYRPSSFAVIDNGHTVQVNVGPGNTIQVMGRTYELVQFHFHRPSEERINGRAFDMVAHLVHKDLEGRLAVVAVLLDRGAAQPVIQTVWNNLPLEKGEALPARVTLDPGELLPADRRYYTYMGSLTTPPCSEGVLWMVLKQPVQVSIDQINLFARLYPMNARPIQSVSGRVIKQSN
ncbi:MAG: carbonic anhydrase family protein [Rubrivivax sp.]|nr:carbonic anhydrase family protein [Rubrivivax sp.]